MSETTNELLRELIVEVRALRTELVRHREDETEAAGAHGESIGRLVDTLRDTCRDLGVEVIRVT